MSMGEKAFMLKFKFSEYFACRLQTLSFQKKLHTLTKTNSVDFGYFNTHALLCFPKFYRSVINEDIIVTFVFTIAIHTKLTN